MASTPQKVDANPVVDTGDKFTLSRLFRSFGAAINALIDFFPSGVLAVLNGGTGSSTAAGARTSFGIPNHQLVPVDASGNVALPAGLSVPAANGLTSAGYVTLGGPVYLQALVNANPNWNPCNFQAVHFPSVWAGFRLDVNGQFFDLRNNGIGYCPGGWTVTSDRRRKTDMQPVLGALQKVAALTAYTYLRPDIVDEFAKTPKRYLGLVAQDARAVAPETVVEDADEDKTLSLDYGAIAALNTQAIKELHAIVRQQQQAIQLLQGRANG